MTVHPKVVNAAVAGAVVTIILWLLTIYTSITPPPETVSAISLLVMTLIGYLTPSPVSKP